MKKLSNSSKVDTLQQIAWRRGILRWKLHDYQLPLYNSIRGGITDPNVLKYTVNCSRRFGKSFVICLIAIEEALQNKNFQIRFATTTGKAMRKIIKPIFKAILEDCPDAFKPKFNTQDSYYVFPNGSEIHISGCDNGNYENLRGTASDLNIVDEAGFIDDLDYIVHSVLMPQTLTTGGTTILISTPPSTPAHDFYSIAIDCKEANNYSIYTIYDNTSIDQKTRDIYAKESGGYESSTFKREYLGEFVIDEQTQLIPEWNDDYSYTFTPDQYFQYYYKYVSIDIGTKDFTAILLGYYDFKQAKLFIMDEITMSGNEMTTDVIADRIKEKEKEWFQEYTPHKRIADNNNLQLVSDLTVKHGLTVLPTSKQSLDAMLNKVRMLIKDGRLVVHPRCTMLVGNLKHGVWDKQRKAFARSKTYKHYDHLASLVYMCINIDTHTNPVPSITNNHFDQYRPNGVSSNTSNVIKTLFGGK